MVGDRCLGNDVDVVVFVDGGWLMMVDIDDDVMTDRILISRISENHRKPKAFLTVNPSTL